MLCEIINKQNTVLNSAWIRSWFALDMKVTLAQWRPYYIPIDTLPQGYQYYQIHPLWPSETIWRRRSGSTLDKLTACCLMAPSHYLNQCWLKITGISQFQLGNFTENEEKTCWQKFKFKNKSLKILMHLPADMSYSTALTCEEQWSHF